MKNILLIIILFSCSKDEPFDRSYYLHGGGFKVWAQTARTRTEAGNTQDQQPRSVRYVFYSDNAFAISSDMDNKGLWALDGDVLTIIINGVPIGHKVLALNENELSLESVFHNITYTELWKPI